MIRVKDPVRVTGTPTFLHSVPPSRNKSSYVCPLFQEGHSDEVNSISDFRLQFPEEVEI